MAHVEEKELYPIYYAVHLHESGKQAIPSLALPDDMISSLGRFRKKHGGTITPPIAPLTQDRVKSAIKHTKNCGECQIRLYEDGPESDRPKTLDEIAAEERAEAEEEAKLVRKFFVSAAYALVAFFVGWFCFYKHNVLDRAKIDLSENTLRSLDTPGGMPHPLEMAGFGLFFVTAWGIATCWGIARHSFLDFGRVQEAVPLVGQAWASRSKRKRKERDQAAREAARGKRG